MQPVLQYYDFGSGVTAFRGSRFSYWDRYLGMMTAMTQVPTTAAAPHPQLPVPVTTFHLTDSVKWIL